jgi:hypothetical protein
MAYTLSDFLRTWTVTDTHDLMNDYVNADKMITLQIESLPDLVRCVPATGYSKAGTPDWSAARWTATIDPNSPPNIMLRSRAADATEKGIDGNNVYFRITAEPGDGDGRIRCYMVTTPNGTWNGDEH